MIVFQNGKAPRKGNPALWLVDEVKRKEYKWSFSELAEKSKRF